MVLRQKTKIKGIRSFNSPFCLKSIPVMFLPDISSFDFMSSVSLSTPERLDFMLLTKQISSIILFKKKHKVMIFQRYIDE